jgi:hypothetical protein
MLCQQKLNGKFDKRDEMTDECILQHLRLRGDVTDLIMSSIIFQICFPLILQIIFVCIQDIPEIIFAFCDKIL